MISSWYKIAVNFLGSYKSFCSRATVYYPVMLTARNVKDQAVWNAVMVYANFVCVWCWTCVSTHKIE